MPQHTRTQTTPDTAQDAHSLQSWESAICIGGRGSGGGGAHVAFHGGVVQRMPPVKVSLLDLHPTSSPPSRTLPGNTTTKIVVDDDTKQEWGEEKTLTP
eukprot:347514-Rhodomonas_salina.3